MRSLAPPAPHKPGDGARSEEAYRHDGDTSIYPHEDMNRLTSTSTVRRTSPLAVPAAARFASMPLGKRPYATHDILMPASTGGGRYSMPGRKHQRALVRQVVIGVAAERGLRDYCQSIGAAP